MKDEILETLKELIERDGRLMAINRTSVEMYIEIEAGSESAPKYYNLDVAGKSFYLIDCTGEIEISSTHSPYKTYRKATGENFPMDQAFERLELRNKGAKVGVRIWAGWGEYIDRRFELLEAHTKAYGWDEPSQAIPADSHVDFAPDIGNGKIRRKSIQVTNLDPNENLRMEDSSGNTILTVFPRSSITLPVSDTIRINNDTGSAISCNVSEIYYVEGNLITSGS